MFKKIVEAFVTFKLSGADLFNKANVEGMNIAKTREFFIKKFPSKFIQFLNEKPHLRKNYLFSKLFVQTKNNKVPVTNLQMQGNDIDNALGDLIMMDWEDLLLSSDKEERMMGVNLFIYSYFRNGLRMGRGSFSQYASSVVRLAIPGYMEAVYSITNNSSVFSPQEAERFKDQFIKNTYTFNNILNNVNIMGSTDNIFIRSDNRIIITNKAISVLSKLKNKGALVEYVSMTIKGKVKDALYKVVDRRKDGYVELNPVNSLGRQGLFLEYDINSDLNESVFR